LDYDADVMGPSRPPISSSPARPPLPPRAPRPGVDLGAEPIEPRFLLAAVFLNPGLQFIKRLGAQGVKTPLAVCTDVHEPRFLQDPQMTRDSRLMDVYLFDEFAH